MAAGRKTVGVTGFEPATTRSQSGCATKLRHTPYYPREGVMIRSERVTGIEPAPSAWKAEVLPLNYTRMHTTTVDGHAPVCMSDCTQSGFPFANQPPLARRRARDPTTGNRHFRAGLRPNRVPRKLIRKVCNTL